MGLCAHIRITAKWITRHHDIGVVVHEWIDYDFHGSDKHFTWPTVQMVIQTRCKIQRKAIVPVAGASQGVYK